MAYILSKQDIEALLLTKNIPLRINAVLGLCNLYHVSWRHNSREFTILYTAQTVLPAQNS